ncbi:transcriptional regulator [Nostoc sp. 3335mG]|nr:transcriptional regulator [Nostoc sp. 3335mG]
MPEISRFRGVIVYMYHDDHAPPHFHVTYQGFEAAIDIKTRGVVAGRIPPKVHAYVVQWAGYYEDELLENWIRCQNGHKPQKIRPL